MENVLPVWYSTPGTDTGYSATRSGPGVCTAGQLLHLPTRSVRLSGTDKAYENSKLLRLFGTATAYDGTKVPETLVRKTVRGVGCGTDALYHGLPCRPHRSLSSKGCRSTMRSQILFRAELRTPEPKVLAVQWDVVFIYLFAAGAREHGVVMFLRFGALARDARD